jgi:hypothetical protein
MLTVSLPIPPMPIPIIISLTPPRLLSHPKPWTETILPAPEKFSTTESLSMPISLGLNNLLLLLKYYHNLSSRYYFIYFISIANSLGNIFLLLIRFDFKFSMLILFIIIIINYHFSNSDLGFLYYYYYYLEHLDLCCLLFMFIYA